MLLPEKQKQTRRRLISKQVHEDLLERLEDPKKKVFIVMYKLLSG